MLSFALELENLRLSFVFWEMGIIMMVFTLTVFVTYLLHVFVTYLLHVSVSYGLFSLRRSM